MVGKMPQQALDKSYMGRAALYGKIPAHGDFVSRGLERLQRSDIDGWLTEWMKLAKNEWTDGFEDNYRSAQPWLFSSENLTAILMPSFDKVERLFPIFAYVGGGAIIQDVYDAAFSAIAENETADQLFESLKALNCDADFTEAKGWFLPAPKEVAMPHPFFGGETDWVRGLCSDRNI